MARDDRKAPPDASREGADGADIDAAIDALYQGPLAEFVNERNRLARDLRGRDREAAERVRTLAKPPISAWAVNQAFWHARPQFSAMLDAGEAVRALQQRVMRGEAVEGLAAASARLHEAVAPVARAAQDALEQDGHSAPPQLMRRVITTLQAIAAHGRADTAPPAGRLSADVDAPGFDLLTALAPAHVPVARRTEAVPTRATSAHRRTTRPEPRADAEDTSDTEPAATRPAPAEQHTRSRGAHRSARSAHRPAGAPRSRQEAQARHAARARASAARAALVARQRALTSAERAEGTAAERLDAAEAAVAAARAALDRATMARDRAAQAHEQAQAEASEARAAFVTAQDELDSAENQVRALAQDPDADGQEPG